MRYSTLSWWSGWWGNSNAANVLAAALVGRYAVGMMQTIPWPEIVRDLIERGMTQPQIALACKCSQSTISELLNGKTVDPRTSTGLLLLGLHCGEPLYVAPGGVR